MVKIMQVRTETPGAGGDSGGGDAVRSWILDWTLGPNGEVSRETVKSQSLGSGDGDLGMLVS